METPKFRVDVTIRGEQEATLNYAKATDALGVVHAVASALQNDGYEGAPFPVVTLSIAITRVDG